MEGILVVGLFDLWEGPPPLPRRDVWISSLRHVTRASEDTESSDVDVLCNRFSSSSARACSSKLSAISFVGFTDGRIEYRLLDGHVSGELFGQLLQERLGISLPLLELLEEVAQPCDAAFLVASVAFMVCSLARNGALGGFKRWSTIRKARRGISVDARQPYSCMSGVRRFQLRDGPPGGSAPAVRGCAPRLRNCPLTSEMHGGPN